MMTRKTAATTTAPISGSNTARRSVRSTDADRTDIPEVYAVCFATMRKSFLILSSLLLLFASRTNWKDVEQALGRAGSLQPGDVYKVSFPRGDLTVTLDGVTIKPALALGSWAAFKEIGGGHALTM